MLTFLKRMAHSVMVAGLVFGALAGVARAEEVVTLKLHHFLPAVWHGHTGMLIPWAEKIEKESGGRIKIEIYPSMQLGGKPPQLASQVRDGVVDIAWTLPGYTPGQFPRTEVFELPFMHASTVATNKALADFVSKHDDDFKSYKVISVHVHGGQSFHSRKPISSVDDIAGTRIRTPTRTGAWMIEAMGAVPIGAPVPKIPEMLSRGIVDSVLIPFEVVPALKVEELVDHHVLLDGGRVTRINTTTFMMVMNRARYESLPADLQKVIDDNSGMNIAAWLGGIWDRAEQVGINAAAESGMVSSLPRAEVDALRAMTEQPVVDRWIKEVSEKGIDGAALVREARDLIAKYETP